MTFYLALIEQDEQVERIEVEASSPYEARLKIAELYPFSERFLILC